MTNVNQSEHFFPSWSAGRADRWSSELGRGLLVEGHRSPAGAGGQHPVLQGLLPLALRWNPEDIRSVFGKVAHCSYLLEPFFACDFKVSFQSTFEAVLLLTSQLNRSLRSNDLSVHLFTLFVSGWGYDEGFSARHQIHRRFSQFLLDLCQTGSFSN